MPEEPGYMLTQIVALSRELASSEGMAIVFAVVTVTGAALTVIGMLVNIRARRRARYAVPDTGLLAAYFGIAVMLVGALFAGGLMYDAVMTSHQLDMLVASYESLYGPLPEGVLR